MNDNNVSEIIDSKIIDNDNGKITAGVMREVLHAIDKAAIERHGVTETSIKKTAESLGKDILNSKNDIEANERDIKRLDEKTTTLSSQIENINEINSFEFIDLYRLAYRNELKPGKRYMLINSLGYLDYEFEFDIRQGRIGVLDYPSIIVEAATESTFREEALRYDSKRKVLNSVRWTAKPTDKLVPEWMRLSAEVVQEMLQNQSEEGRLTMSDGVVRKVFSLYGYDNDFYIYYPSDTANTISFAKDADDGGFEPDEDTTEYPLGDISFVFAGWKGAVTWMRDEHGNEAPFDFKSFGATNINERFRDMLWYLGYGEIEPGDVIRIVNGKRNIYKDASLFIADSSSENNVIENCLGYAGLLQNSSISDSCLWAQEVRDSNIRFLRMRPLDYENGPVVSFEKADIFGDSSSTLVKNIEEMFYNHDNVIGLWYFDVNMNVMRKAGAPQIIVSSYFNTQLKVLVTNINTDFRGIVRFGCLCRPNSGPKKQFFKVTDENGDLVAEKEFEVPSNNNYASVNLEWVKKTYSTITKIEYVDPDTGERVQNKDIDIQCALCLLEDLQV